MNRWHDALRSYRRRSLRDDQHTEPNDVMFVLCSENYAAAELVAAVEPAIVLQSLGGARSPSDAGVRATFEYGIVRKSVRQVVVCGHLDCCAVAADGGDSRAATEADVSAQCRALRDDAFIGELFREHRVVIRSLWFDEPEGDIYLCGFDNPRAGIMGDADFGRMVALFTRARV